jgi:hypothetical protein
MTQTQIRRTGIVERWMGRYGFIFVTYKERYFMPLVEFDAPRSPVVGERVEFEFTPAPVVPGLPPERNLPTARNVKPIPGGVVTFHPPATTAAKKKGEGGVS